MVYYLGANLEWFGRQLNSYIIPDDAETTDVNESLNVSYTYDADGLRTSKTVVEKTPTDEYTYNYTYQYVGDKLYYLCANDENGNLDYEMYFFYDSYDKLTVLKYFKHTGENPGQYTYYVATNYFGDVVALYSGQGELLVSYEYDAWGNIIAVRDADEALITDSDSIAHRNPIRYRSYYYDTETGLYYLQSRYYNPEIGRFLNADGLLNGNGDILGYNMFAYCSNNPVMFNDKNGCGFLKDLLTELMNTIIDSMSKSKNSKISFVGGLLKSVRDGYNTGKAIVEIENPLNKPSKIKRQYVQDIYDVGVNKKVIVQTPDPYIFPDVKEYNQRCLEKFNYLSTNSVYSNTLGQTFDMNAAQESIIKWDVSICLKLVNDTIYVSFTETMVAIAKEIYGYTK